MRIRQLSYQAVVADVTLAALSSVVTVLGIVALSAMIFSGPLVSSLHLAFLCFLAGSSVAAIFIGWLSSFYCNISGAQDQPAAILAVLASALTSAGVADGAAIMSTVFAAIALSTGSFGLFLLLLSWLRVGKYTQLIPYPVVGGFLAGVGVLVFVGTIRFLCGFTPSLQTLPSLFSVSVALQWVPSLVAALALYWGMRTFQHLLFVPVGLLVILVLFYAAAGAFSVSLDSLRAGGFVFAALPEGALLDGVAKLSFAGIDWPSVLNKLPEIGALILVCTIGASLATTAVEIGAEVDLDPNHELRMHGFANLAAAFTGGLPAFTMAGPSLSYVHLGASSRLVPLLRGVFSLIIGIAGLGFLEYVPKVMVGTLLMLVAAGLMDEWIVRSRNRLSASDYIIVLIITGIIAFVGLLPGVIAGIIAAVLDFQVKYSRLNVIKTELSGRYFRSDVERSHRAEAILREIGERAVTFELQGFIFFGTATGLLEQVRERIGTSRSRIEFIILGFEDVDGLDASAHLALKKIGTFARARNITLLFSGLTPATANDLRSANVLGEDNSRCFDDTARAVEWVENRLLEANGWEDLPLGIEDALTSIMGSSGKAQELLPYFSSRDIPSGGTVFEQGAEDQGVILLLKGNLSAHLDLGNGQTVRLRKFLPGTLTGEMAFYTDHKRSASLIADTAATMAVISSEHLARLHREQPASAAEFHLMAAKLMAHRIVSMNALVRVLHKRHADLPVGAGVH